MHRRESGCRAVPCQQCLPAFLCFADRGWSSNPMESIRLPGLPLLRAYAKTASMAATAQFSDGLLAGIELLLRLGRVLILLALWRAVLGDQGEANGLTTAALLTYALIGEVFADQLLVRTDLSSVIWEGTIATRLLWPIGLVSLFLSDAIGRWCFGWLLFSLPVLLLAPFIGVDPRPASIAHGGLFIVSLVLAIAVGVAIEFIFAALVFIFEQPVWMLDAIRRAITLLLSGQVLPLALMPWGIGEVFAWLPFASMASAPLQMFVGAGDPVRLLLIQVFWAIALWPLAQWLWIVGREKTVGYGG